MRILVTGMTGFAGGHLTEALLAKGGAELIGLSRNGKWPGEWRHLASQTTLRACDLADRARLEELLRQIQPEQIFHLAGYAHVGRSFQEPDAAWDGNLTATRSLFETVGHWGARPRILFVGSGLIYGDSPSVDQALDEQCPLRPTSPYSASKAAADLVSFQCGHTFGLPVVGVRPFNHIGPRQAPDFAISHFARQVAAIRLGRQLPVMETGNLSPRRDLTDVRDMVQAYLALMDRGQAGEAYNIGTGQTRSMGEVLDRMLQIAKVSVEIRQRADLVRAREVAAVRADATKIRQATGWEPSHTLDQTLADTIDYWQTALRLEDIEPARPKPRSQP
jgi:GDP-4-dehydro-6-deoxy-D-mannose reductase